MNKTILITILLLAISKPSFGQSTKCGAAVSQLQSYVLQVNQSYSNEYNQIIPMQRCPAYDAWNRPYAAQIVQNCRVQMVGYLNQWYGQQSNYVNNWYFQIMQSCANPDRNIPSPTNNDTIDEDEIKNLTAGIDEDKAVRITIPKTAAGFKPN